MTHSPGLIVIYLRTLEKRCCSINSGCLNSSS